MTRPSSTATGSATTITSEAVKRFCADCAAQEAALPDLTAVVLPQTEQQRIWSAGKYLQADRQRAVELWTGIERKQAQLDILLPVHAAMVLAKAEFERDIAGFDAVKAKHSGIEGELKWRNHEAQVAALEAIDRGVEFMDGRPLVPNPLYAFLAQRSMTWKGPLPMLAERVTKLRNEIAAAYAALATLLNGNGKD